MGLASLAAILVFAGEFDANGIVALETRGGEAPLFAGGPTTPGVVGILTPGMELRYRRSDLTLLLNYGPRVFWRQPNPESSGRLLILHVSSVSATAAVTPTVTLRGGGAASVGDADYSTISSVFGATGPPTQSTPAPGSGTMGTPTTQTPGTGATGTGAPGTGATGTLPAAPGILSVSARVAAEVAASRIWRFVQGVDVGHRRPLGTPATFTPQTNLGTDPTAIVRLSRRDELLLTTTVSDRWYSDGVNFFSVTPQVGWQTRLSSADDLRVSGGVTYGRYLGTAPVPGTVSVSGVAPVPAMDASRGSRAAFAPVGRVDANRLLLRHRGVAMRGTASAVLDYFVDPVLQTSGSRGSASVGWSVSFVPEWSIGIDGSFTTSLEPRPLPLFIGGIPPDETVAAASVSARHRASENLEVEFGVRWSDRAPHLHSPAFEFHQRQIWAYLTLTATTKDQSRRAP